MGTGSEIITRLGQLARTSTFLQYKHQIIGPELGSPLILVYDLKGGPLNEAHIQLMIRSQWQTTRGPE